MKLDLGYGNPGFIQELCQSTLKLELAASMQPYFQGKHAQPELVKAIFAIHAREQNVVLTPRTKVVVTVGAVQAVQAALAYLQVQGYKKVYIPAPFWGRFVDFAKLINLEIVSEPANDAFSLVTSPNNPDGKDQFHLPTLIRDACYNWSTYVPRPYCQADLMTIFSLSKLSGYSSTRIGWVITEDETVAHFIQNYVNNFTSGVSIESQVAATTIIQQLLAEPKILETAKLALRQRQQQLTDLITQGLPMRLLSSQGMFAYVQCESKVIEDLDIEAVAGNFFQDSTPNIYRLNLGVTSGVFQEFMARAGKLVPVAASKIPQLVPVT